jgi:hypothetical protein
MGPLAFLFTSVIWTISVLNELHKENDFGDLLNRQHELRSVTHKVEPFPQRHRNMCTLIGSRAEDLMAQCLCRRFVQSMTDGVRQPEFGGVSALIDDERKCRYGIKRFAGWGVVLQVRRRLGAHLYIG